MGSKRLILKKRHWRYTIGSVVLLLPILLTVAASVAVWLANIPIAETILHYFLKQQGTVLAGVWFVLPLLSIYLAHASYRRGTIDRWRPLNKFTKTVGIACLLVVVSFAVIG